MRSHLLLGAQDNIHPANIPDVKTGVWVTANCGVVMIVFGEGHTAPCFGMDPRMAKDLAHEILSVAKVAAEQVK